MGRSDVLTAVLLAVTFGFALVGMREWQKREPGLTALSAALALSGLLATIFFGIQAHDDAASGNALPSSPRATVLNSPSASAVPAEGPLPTAAGSGSGSGSGSIATTASDDDYAAVALSPSHATAATLYFGRLAQVLAATRRLVSSRVDATYKATHAGQCVGTVVVTGLSGSKGAVYALGLGSGWTAAEGAPDENVSTDDGVLHHQLVIPPVAATSGTEWRWGARVVIDQNPGFATGSVLVRLSGRSGDSRAFTVGGTTVRCTT